jgi:hypothetical protein
MKRILKTIFVFSVFAGFQAQANMMPCPFKSASPLVDLTAQYEGLLKNPKINVQLPVSAPAPGTDSNQSNNRI